MDECRATSIGEMATAVILGFLQLSISLRKVCSNHQTHTLFFYLCSVNLRRAKLPAISGFSPAIFTTRRFGLVAHSDLLQCSHDGREPGYAWVALRPAEGLDLPFLSCHLFTSFLAGYMDKDMMTSVAFFFLLRAENFRWVDALFWKAVLFSRALGSF